MSDKLIIGDGSAQELASLEARAAHEAADVAEGLCPVHRELMRPADTGGELIAGHCTPCRKYWWYDTRRGQIGSAPDRDPRSFPRAAWEAP
jgi:hypothetical protein